MEERFNPFKAAPGAYKAMSALQAYVSGSEVETSIRHLVALRASQINGCAFCLAMHAREAREHGESDVRIHLLNAWREAGVFTPRERAALAWTEALTQVAKTHAPDDVYEEARAHFSEKELADLTMAIVAINGWNRIAIGLRSEPGIYQPARKAAAGAKG